MMIVLPPTYPLLAYIVTGPAGVDFTLGWAQAGMTVTVLLAEPASSAIASPAAITVFVGSAWVVGTLAQFQPSTQPTRWRRSYSSATSYLVASDLNNQGTVTSGQFPGRVATVNPWLVGAGGPGFDTMYAVKMLEIPLNEPDMTAVDPKIRVAPAKQGVYQPLYNLGPAFDWALPDGMACLGTNQGALNPQGVWAPSAALNLGAAQPAGVPSLLFPVDTTNNLLSDYAAAYTAMNANPMLPTCPYTYGTDNTMSGVSIWRGLSPAASVTTKFVLGLEVCPSPTSPIRQFVVPAADYEPKALQLYFDLVHDMPHTYPASSNFLGAVLAAVSSLLPSVLPHISGVIRSVQGAVGVYREHKAAAAREDQPEMAGSSSSRVAAAPKMRTFRPARAASVSSRRSRPSSSKSGRKVKVAGRRRRRR
jgi:hypothetical protein